MRINLIRPTPSPCHVCQTLVDKIATQDAAARAMLAALKELARVAMWGDDYTSRGEFDPAHAAAVEAIAQAHAAGIKVQL